MYFVYKFIFYTSSSTVFVCVFSGCHWKQLHCSRLLPDAACSSVCCLLPSSCWLHALRERRRIYAVEVGADCQTITASVSHTVCVCVCVCEQSLPRRVIAVMRPRVQRTVTGQNSPCQNSLLNMICAKAAEPIRCGFVMIVDGAHEWTQNPACLGQHTCTRQRRSCL